MTMKTSTAYNHQERLIRLIDSIYSSARAFRLPSDAINKRMKEQVWEDPAMTRVPVHVRSYISGYQRAIYNQHWREVEWVFPWQGIIYKNWSNLPEAGRQYYMSKDALGQSITGLHVYKTDNKKHYTGNPDAFNAGL